MFNCFQSNNNREVVFAMPFVWHFLVLLLGVSMLIIPGAEADNVYLHRLKKLRNNFLAQVEEQVASNDAIVEQSYVDTMQTLVDKLSSAQEDAIADIKLLLKSFESVSAECVEQIQPQGLYTKTDAFLQGCVAEADQGAESISEYVITEIEQYQSRSSDFSIWFLSAYLSDWEKILGESHYDDVYEELAPQVVEWDNVGSINLYQLRQEVIKRLGTLSVAIDECTIKMTEFIAEEYEVMHTNSLKCR